MKIEDCIRDHYCKTLYELAKIADPRGVILELGVGSWGSGAHLCEGSQAGMNIPVYGVDNFSMEGTSLTNVLSEMKDRRLVGVLAEKLLIMDTSEAAMIWNYPISLLFIDADHSYKACKADFYGFYEYVLQDGFIAFHDSERPEIKRVVKEVEHLLYEGIEVVDDDGRGCYFSRKR